MFPGKYNILCRADRVYTMSRDHKNYQNGCLLIYRIKHILTALLVGSIVLARKNFITILNTDNLKTWRGGLITFIFRSAFVWRARNFLLPGVFPFHNITIPTRANKHWRKRVPTTIPNCRSMMRKFCNLGPTHLNSKTPLFKRCRRICKQRTRLTCDKICKNLRTIAKIKLKRSSEIKYLPNHRHKRMNHETLCRCTSDRYCRAPFKRENRKLYLRTITIVKYCKNIKYKVKVMKGPNLDICSQSIIQPDENQNN